MNVYRGVYVSLCLPVCVCAFSFQVQIVCDKDTPYVGKKKVAW